MYNREKRRETSIHFFLHRLARLHTFYTTSLSFFLVLHAHCFFLFALSLSSSLCALHESNGRWGGHLILVRRSVDSKLSSAPRNDKQEGFAFAALHLMMRFLYGCIFFYFSAGVGPLTSWTRCFFCRFVSLLLSPSCFRFFFSDELRVVSVHSSLRFFSSS